VAQSLTKDHSNAGFNTWCPDNPVPQKARTWDCCFWQTCSRCSSSWCWSRKWTRSMRSTCRSRRNGTTSKYTVIIKRSTSGLFSQM